MKAKPQVYASALAVLLLVAACGTETDDKRSAVAVKSSEESGVTHSEAADFHLGVAEPQELTFEDCLRFCTILQTDGRPPFFFCSFPAHLETKCKLALGEVHYLDTAFECGMTVCISNGTCTTTWEQDGSCKSHWGK